MMRKSLFDDFLYYIPESDHIVLCCRDIKVSGVWEWFILEENKSRWEKEFKAPGNWVLIDRFPERWFSKPIKLPW